MYLTDSFWFRAIHRLLVSACTWQYISPFHSQYYLPTDHIPSTHWPRCLPSCRLERQSNNSSHSPRLAWPPWLVVSHVDDTLGCQHSPGRVGDGVGEFVRVSRDQTVFNVTSSYSMSTCNGQKWGGVLEKWSVCSLPKSTKVFRLYAGSLTTWDTTVEQTVFRDSEKTDLLISDQIQLIKHSIVLCEVFVLQLLLFLAKNGAVDLFFFWFFHCLAGNPPFLCCRCINNIDATNLFMMGIFLIQLLSFLSRLPLLSLPGAQDWEWGRQSRRQPPS